MGGRSPRSGEQDAHLGTPTVRCWKRSKGRGDLMNRIYGAVIAVAVALVIARPAASQSTAGTATPSLLGLAATRRGLEARAERLESTSVSTTQPAATRADAAREAAEIRRRLSEGDFRVGDRIVMVVEGEPTLSDTFTVGPAIGLTLPAVG